MGSRKTEKSSSLITIIQQFSTVNNYLFSNYHTIRIDNFDVPLFSLPFILWSMYWRITPYDYFVGDFMKLLEMVWVIAITTHSIPSKTIHTQTTFLFCFCWRLLCLAVGMICHFFISTHCSLWVYFEDSANIATKYQVLFSTWLLSSL